MTEVVEGASQPLLRCVKALSSDRSRKNSPPKSDPFFKENGLVFLEPPGFELLIDEPPYVLVGFKFVFNLK